MIKPSDHPGFSRWAQANFISPQKQRTCPSYGRVTMQEGSERCDTADFEGGARGTGRRTVGDL